LWKDWGLPRGGAALSILNCLATLQRASRPVASVLG
jgi:hypothetical protein